MRLVWAIIPLVFFSVIGVQESFAQTYDLSDYPGEWYVGEGLKQGDYFEYSLCHADYNDCAPIELRMWIKGTIPHGTETLWDAKVVIFEDNKIIKGSMGLGKIVPEPVVFDDNIFDYAMAFRSSLAWLSAFTTANEGVHGPKEFSDKTWSGKFISIGSIGGPYPLRAETISIQAGTFDTVVVGWNFDGYSNNDIWIVDNFPFPVKAIIHELRSVDTSENLMYELELLDYKENILVDPFIGIDLISFLDLGECVENYDLVDIKEPTNSFNYILEVKYGPEEPENGCEIEWFISFKNKYSESIFESQVQYDIFVVDDDFNIPPQRSIAAEEGKDFLYAPSGFVHINTLVKENPGIAHYVIYIYGTSPEFIVPPPDGLDYYQIDIPILGESSIIPPPRTQLKQGIAPEEVVCNEGKQLIFKPNNSPVCVKSSTAEKLIERGWGVGPDNNKFQNLFEVKVTQIINGTTITKSYYFATQEEADYFEQKGKGNKSKLLPEGYIPYKTPKISPELQEILDSEVERVDVSIILKNTPKPPPDFLEMTDEEQVANLQERYAQIRMMQQDLVDYITNNDGVVIKQLEFINSVYADVPVTIIDELKNRDDIRIIGYYDKDAKSVPMPIHPPG